MSESHLPPPLPPRPPEPSGLRTAPPAAPPAPPPANVLPLGYSTGTNLPRPQPRTPFAGRVAIGCFGYALLTAGWIALGALSPTAGRYAFTGWFLMTGGLLGLALYVRLRYGFSGVGYGILLSLGVFGTIALLLCVGLVLLLIALCGQKSGSNTPATSTPYSSPPATVPATLPAVPMTAPATEPAGP